MLSISEILMKHHELSSFPELVEFVRQCARAGEMFVEIDLRPPFADTPENWEQQLEAAFTSADNVR